MAITYDNKSQDVDSGTAISFTHTPTGTPTLAVVCFLIRSDTVSVTNYPTYGGQNMAKADRVTDATNAISAEIWYLANPPSGAQTVAATLSGTDDSRTICTTYLGTSTNQASVLDQHVYDDNATTVNITPLYDNELIVGGIVSESGSAPATGSGETNIYNNDEGTWSSGASYAIQTTKGTQAINWTSTEAAVIAASFTSFVTTSQANSAKANFVQIVSSNNSSLAALGSQIYSRESKTSLPTNNDTTLATIFSSSEIAELSDNDEGYVATTGSGYLIHLFKVRNDNQSSSNAIAVSWNGKSSISCQTSTVYLQIYNRTGTSWTTLDSDNLTGANTDFNLEGTQSTDLTDYYDANYWVSVRVYQQHA